MNISKEEAGQIPCFIPPLFLSVADPFKIYSVKRIRTFYNIWWTDVQSGRSTY